MVIDVEGGKEGAYFTPSHTLDDEDEDSGQDNVEDAGTEEIPGGCKDLTRVNGQVPIDEG